MGAGLCFTETMEGSWRPASGADAPMRFEVTAETDTMLRPFGTVTGRLSGRVWIDGLASGAQATGAIEVSPLARRRIRYTLDFCADDGAPLQFDGWKSIQWRRPLSTWTTLPGTVYDAGRGVVGTALLRFPMRDTAALVGGARLVDPAAGARLAISGGGAGPVASDASVGSLYAPRWDGRSGRLEVWYDTFTNPSDGSGFWLHHELCAPSGPGGGEHAEQRGWVAVFPSDGEPVWRRFGPSPAGARSSGGRISAGTDMAGTDMAGTRDDGGSVCFSSCDVVVAQGRRRGRAGEISWDLKVEDCAAPLFTFPRWAWRRAILPGAQIVPSPSARYRGTVTVGAHEYHLGGAPGAAARIYGHGNAARWAWLHADLGDDHGDGGDGDRDGSGDVLEIVAATPHRRGLERMAPLPLLQLRLGGTDWPAYPLRAARRFHCELAQRSWSVAGAVGNRRVRVEVSLPAERCVEIGYSDPDGTTATCVNSERSDAWVRLEHRHANGQWRIEREWILQGTAHAELGHRP